MDGDVLCSLGTCVVQRRVLVLVLGVRGSISSVLRVRESPQSFSVLPTCSPAVLSLWQSMTALPVPCMAYEARSDHMPRPSGRAEGPRVLCASSLRQALPYLKVLVAVAADCSSWDQTEVTPSWRGTKGAVPWGRGSCLYPFAVTPASAAAAFLPSSL